MYFTLEEKLNNLRNIDMIDMESVLDAHTKHIVSGHINASDETYTKNFVFPHHHSQKHTYSFKINDGTFLTESDNIPVSLKKEICSYIRANFEELEERIRDPEDSMEGCRLCGLTTTDGIMIAFDEEQGSLKYSRTEGFGLGIEKSSQSKISGIVAKTLINNKPKNEESYHIRIEDYFAAHPELDKLSKFSFYKSHVKNTENQKVFLRESVAHEKKLTIKSEDIDEGCIFYITAYDNGRLEGSFQNPQKGIEIRSVNPEIWQKTLNEYPECKKIWENTKNEYRCFQEERIQDLFPKRNNKYINEQSQAYKEKYDAPNVKHITSSMREKLNSVGLQRKTESMKNTGLKKKPVIIIRSQNHN